MISALHRKLVRDLWSIKGQALAIGLVTAAGVATFVMSLSTLRSLKSARDQYYESSRFADVFLSLKRAPRSLADRLAEIPGVRLAEPRIVIEVALDLPDLSEPAIGRILSLPSHRLQSLNRLMLRRGRTIDPNRAGEVILSQAFADAHGFRPGDQIRAIINARRQTLTIVGVGLSPEYLIQIRGGSLIPDEKRFGVMWMDERQLAAALRMEGAFNDIALSLRRGATEGEVLRQLDQFATPFGGIGAYGRQDQVSHQYISQEIQQLSTMGVLAPSIFLSVAAFLLNVVMSRLISTQREQIAALKAFGYGKLEIGRHYLEMVLVLVVLGASVGTALGLWMGLGLTGMYCQFYKFPDFSYRCDAFVLATAYLLSGGAAILGTLTAVRSAVRLPPAEAMRPEPPARYRPTWLERWGLGGFLPPTVRMILRQMERRPAKTIFSCMGIALAVSVLVLGSFSEDALQHMIHYQFFDTQRQDMTVTFFEPVSSRAISEIAHLPGVLRCEPFRSVPTRIRFEHVERRVALMGLTPGNDLYRLLDDEHRLAQPADEGLLLSDKLAKLLGVRHGDAVEVEVLEGERHTLTLPVSGIVREYGGLNAYLQRPAVLRALGEQGSLSGAFLQVDDQARAALHTRLKQIPRVSSVTMKSAALQNFENTIGENLMRIRFYNVLFASIIACGVVYNGARVSLAERAREFASLRVLGFTRGEVSALLLGELAILTAAAIPLGLVVGYALSAWASTGMETELFTIPLVIDRATYGMAAGVTLLATIVSGLIVRRRVDKLDLVAVLKTRE